MMKRILIFLTLCLLAGQELSAQATSAPAGTDFLDNKPLAEVLSQAKAEGKLVFVDCYTTWCGPCKMMATQVFPQARVGAFMNEKFTSLKVDMEKGEGPLLGRRYQVRAYPTFLVLDADGQEQGRLVGSQPADEFIGNLSGLLQGPSLALLESQWAGGERSTPFLTQYYQRVKAAGQSERTREVAAALLNGKTGELLHDSLLAAIFVQNMPEVFTDSYRYVWHHRQDFRQRYGNTFDRQLELAWEYAPYGMISGRGKEATLDEQRMKDYMLLMEEEGVEHREELAARGYIVYALVAQRWKDVKDRIADYDRRFSPATSLLRHWSIPVLRAEDSADNELADLQQWLSSLIEQKEKTAAPAASRAGRDAVPMTPLR